MKNRIINTLKKASDLLLYLLFSFTIFFVSFLVMFLFTKLVLSWPVPAFAFGFGLTFYAAKVMNFGWASEVLTRYDKMVDAAMGKTEKVVKKRKSKKKSGPTGTDGVWEGE